MRGRHGAPVAGRQQDRQAIGRLHHAGDARLDRDAGVRLVHAGARFRIMPAQGNDTVSVHLTEEDRLGADRLGQMRRFATTAPGSSPTASPTFIDAYGPALRPPARVLMRAPTPSMRQGGANQPAGVTPRLGRPRAGRW
jgi:hypothetical protein